VKRRQGDEETGGYGTLEHWNIETLKQQFGI